MMEGFGATNPETTPAVPNDQEECPHQLELQFHEEETRGRRGWKLNDTADMAEDENLRSQKRDYFLERKEREVGVTCPFPA